MCQYSARSGADGLIPESTQAKAILAHGDADLILMGRELLRDPNFPLRAAAELYEKVKWPVQYARAKMKKIAQEQIPKDFEKKDMSTPLSPPLYERRGWAVVWCEGLPVCQVIPGGRMAALTAATSNSERAVITATSPLPVSYLYN